MWAHGTDILSFLSSVIEYKLTCYWVADLEKRQHAFASGEKKPIQSSFSLTDVDTSGPSMAGGWQDKKAL